MGIFSRKEKDETGRGGKLVSDDETFVALIQVAREDPEIRKVLKNLLKLDDMNRMSMLGGWLEELRLKGAPDDFVQALGYLKDPDVAKKALEVINGLDDGS